MKPSLILKLFNTFVRHPGYVGRLVRKKIRFAKRYKWILDPRNRNKPVPKPLVIKLVLTYKCNLRCKNCFQLGDRGWEPDQTGELDFSIIERLMEEAGPSHPDFILTGGEPLLYSRFNDLTALLKKHRCQTTICTNGTRLHKQKPNPFLSYLVSLDGREATNDAIRGKGVYKKVTDNIKQLKSLKKPPHVGIQFTIREENIHEIHDFCREMVSLGADWILLNPYWFITEEESNRYERFMETHFQCRPHTHKGLNTPYHPDCETYVKQVKAMEKENWPIQISSYFSKPEQISSYVQNPQNLIKEKRCYKQWIRMDITPNGDVSPCIQFPDLIFGNLKKQKLVDIWNSPDYDKFRKLMSEENLPICAKCNNIYLYDARRKVL